MSARLRPRQQLGDGGVQLGSDRRFGIARIVSLGEATHGTRDLFQMKRRVLDFLVKEMGFTVFAMEASWLEMNRLSHWVQGGAHGSNQWK